MLDYPYFRVTSCSSTHDRETQSWLQHFKDIGVPACIAKTVGSVGGQGRANNAGYAVWRLGEEAVAIGRFANSEKLDGEIIEAVNGFEFVKI